MKYLLTILLSVFAFEASAKLKVMATTTDLEAVVKAVAGDKVETFAVAKGTQDVHTIEAKPSYMVRFRDADLVVAQGIELESAWLTPLVQGARNPKIAQGTPGFLELGEKLNPIEIPSANATRADGDVHPGGNPHFQMDPIRLGQAAVLISERLGELDTANKEAYKTSALAFQKHLTDKSAEWKKRLEKTGVKEVVTYHKTLSYFFDRYGIKSVLQLEPRPGIPPTASHLLEVISQMKARNIHLVLIENYYDNQSEAKLKQEVPGTSVLRVAVSVNGEPGLDTNEKLIERLVSVIEGTVKNKAVAAN